MVLTNNQTMFFFQNYAQMGIPDETVVQLGNEEIMTVDDLVDFEKDTIQQFADSLRRPGGRIPHTTPNSAPRAMILTPPFVFGEKPRRNSLPRVK